MEGGDCVKVEVQVAARDADTRKLVSEMGKRHKWLASDISTSRHLSCVASFVLRHLGLDSSHQVILYPDSSVHSHLQNTAINWGPNFDRAVPLRDIHKIFGGPGKLHFLYHLVTPEVFSPPSKMVHAIEDRCQSAAGDQGAQAEQSHLQPRQLHFQQEPERTQHQMQYAGQLSMQPQVELDLHRIHRPGQLGAPIMWSQPQQQQPPGIPMAYPWQRQQYEQVQQFQEQYHQLCQPLIVAKQQVPLQQLQDNMRSGCGHPQQQLSTAACFHNEGKKIGAADGMQEGPGHQQVQLTLQQPSLPAGRQQQHLQHSTGVPIYPIQGEQQSGPYHSSHSSVPPQQQLGGWPIDARQQQQQHEHCHSGQALQFSTHCHGSAFSQDAAAPSQLRHTLVQPGRGSLALEAHQQYAARHQPPGQQQHEGAPAQQMQASHAAAAQVASAFMPCLSHQSSQQSSRPGHVQYQHEQQQQHQGLGRLQYVAGQEQRANHVACSSDVAAYPGGGLQQQMAAYGRRAEPNSCWQYPPRFTVMAAAQHQQCPQPATSQHMEVAGQLAGPSVRLTLMTADGQSIDVPLSCSTQDGRLFLVPQSGGGSQHPGVDGLMPSSAAQVLSLLAGSGLDMAAAEQPRCGAGGPSAPRAMASNQAPAAEPAAAVLAAQQHQQQDGPTHEQDCSTGPVADKQGLLEQQQQQRQSHLGYGLLSDKQQRHIEGQVQLQQQARQQQQQPPSRVQPSLAIRSDMQARMQLDAGVDASIPAEQGAPATVLDAGLSISAMPVSSAVVSGSAVHSSAAARVPLAIRQNSFAAARSPADVRSHCSSVSCGGGGGTEGAGLHGSSRLAAAGVAKNNGSTLLDVGGSATRSSLPRIDVDGEGAEAAATRPQQQQQQLGGRGILQPRQLNMHQQPLRAHSDQQQWQPQLQHIIEQQDQATDDSAARAAVPGTAQTVAAAVNGATATAPDNAPAEDARDVSGVLELQLENSADEEQHNSTPNDSPATSKGDAWQQADELGLNDVEIPGHQHGDSPRDSQEQAPQRKEQQVQRQSLLQLLQQEESRHEGSQQHNSQPQQELQQAHGAAQDGDHRVQPYEQQQQQTIDSQQPQQLDNQQHSQQYSQQLSEQQSQEYPQQQHTHAAMQPSYQQAVEQQQSQSQTQFHSSVLTATASAGIGLGRNKAPKRPFTTGSVPGITAIGAGAAPAMQPPNKRVAAVRNMRRASAPLPHRRATVNPPADELLMMPSIISKGSSFAGTWHGSVGRWDSRVEQTPVKSDDLVGGTVFSVAELLRQQQHGQQQEQPQTVALVGAPSGASISSKPGGPGGSNARMSSRQSGQQQQPRGQVRDVGHKASQQQALSQGDHSNGVGSQPCSTSLQGWCGTAAAAVAAAVSTGRACSGCGAPGDNEQKAGAATADGEEVDGGQFCNDCDADGNQMLRDFDEDIEAAQQQSAAQQQRQQRHSPDQSRPWEGFQAAQPASGQQEGRTPETFTEQQYSQQELPSELMPAAAAADPQNGVGGNGHSMLIDFERLAAVVNGQSPMEVQQANHLVGLQQDQGQEQAAEPGMGTSAMGTSAPAPSSAAGGGITMHAALKAAGIIPPSPEPAVPQSRTAAMSTQGQTEQPQASAARVDFAQPEEQQLQQQDMPCSPLPVPDGAAVADDGLLLCQLDAADALEVVAEQDAQLQQEEIAAAHGTASAVAAGMVTRRRAAAAVGSVPSSSAAGSDGLSAGDEPSSSDKRAGRQLGSTSSRRKGGSSRSKPTGRCRAPLPSVDQVMLSATSTTPGRRAGKPGSRVPLPPASTLGMLRPGVTGARGMTDTAPQNVAGSQGAQATGGASAAGAAANGGLQRFTLPSGQTVYVAAAKPGGAAATGHARSQLPLPLHQQPAGQGLLDQQLLQHQLLQQHAYQLALLQQQQQQGGAAAPVVGSQMLPTLTAAPAAANGSVPATVAASGANTPLPTAAELAAAVNQLAHGLPSGGVGLSGLLTPGFLSPTGLLSPANGAGTAPTTSVAPLAAAATLDSLEALLADKDFGFFSPEKGHSLMMLNNSSLAGMMSCLNSPSLQQLQCSPQPAAKRSRPPSALHQQQQQLATAEPAGPGSGGTTADLQSLFRTFRGTADLEEAAAAGPATAAGSTSKADMAVPAAAPADLSSGLSKQQQVAAGEEGHVGELYQYLMGAGGDSWLVPPTSAAAAGPATAAVEVGGVLQPANMNAALAVTGAAGENKKGTKRPAAQQSAAAGAATTAAGAPKSKDSKISGAGAGNRSISADSKQQSVPGPMQQPAGAIFNPAKPFAALFPGGGQ